MNLWGVIHGIRTFLPIMLAHGEEGHIVNTASVAGLIAGPFQIPYNISKYGVVALSEGLHRELALIESKIKVSVLCPGFVHTRIMESERNRPAELPLLRIGEAEMQYTEMMRGLWWRRVWRQARSRARCSRRSLTSGSTSSPIPTSGSRSSANG